MPAATEESLAEDIAKLLESFPENEATSRHTLAQLFSANPRSFVQAVVAVLAKSKPGPASRYLVEILTKEKLLPAVLVDQQTRGGIAVAALRTVAGNGTKLQPMLELALNQALQDLASHENTRRILRLLDLLAAIAPASLWNSFQLELAAHPDKMVRSKATMIIGRAAKNAAWIGRRFMDRDPRVQASAVEALWELDAADSKSMLMTASKSRNNRVVGNALLGLYRIAEPKAVSMILEMLRSPEPAFRLTAVWVVGETRDPRFAPVLMELFKTSEGKLRLAVTKSLGRIRRHEKEMADVGTLRIRVSHVALQDDGWRRVVFSLCSRPPRDLSALKRWDFAIIEAGKLVDEFALKPVPNPVVLIAGFVTPQFVAENRRGPAVTQALIQALTLCQPTKRPEDLWRVDRYSTEPPKSDQEDIPPETPSEELAPEVTAKQLFSASAEPLAKMISAETPADKLAPDAFEAAQRLAEALGRLSGKRHLFVFLDESSVKAFDDAERIALLKGLLSSAKIVPHGFALGLSRDVPAFSALCQGPPEGTFHQATLETLPCALEGIYSHLLNAFEIVYRIPPETPAGAVEIKITSDHGIGHAEIAFETPAPPAVPPGDDKTSGDE